MTTDAGKVWSVNAVNEIVLSSGFFNALCIGVGGERE